MGNERGAAARKLALWAVDVACVILSYASAVLIRFGFDFWGLGEYGFSRAAALVLVVLVTVANYLVTINRGFMRRHPFEELRVVLTYNAYLVLGLIVVAFVLRIVPVLSRLVIPLFGVIDVVVMFTARMLVKRMAKRAYGMGIAQDMVVLVAARGRERQALENLELTSGYKVDGVLSVLGDSVKGSVHEVSISCKAEKLADTLVPFRIDEVYISTRGIPSEVLEEMAEGLRDGGVDCHLSLQLPVRDARGGLPSVFGGVPTYSYVKKEHKPFQVFIKRAFDIAVSFVGLLFTAVIGVFLVPIIKFDSPGPAIFSQVRVGKNGRQFKFYKFRSMYQDAEARKAALMDRNRVDGLMFKMDNDPRITKVGRFIRKTSLDEFPQFWNVFVGDMSLVGTRPPTMDEFKRYTSRYKRRLSIKPGITGLWQVSGRSNITDFDDVVALDLEYIDNWSLGLDAKILFKTVRVVFKGTGAG